MPRTQLFISYARKDNKWRLKVVPYLGLLSELIDVWDDSNIGAGQKWLVKINGAMGRARIALLLISVHFLNSDFVKKKEIPDLLKKHESKGMTIYPLLVGYCPWEEVAWLKELQIRPNGEKPVSDYGSKIDKILTQVAREIAAIARTATKKPAKRAQKKLRSKSPRVGRSRAAKKSGATAGKRIAKVRARVSRKVESTRRQRAAKKAKPK